MPDSWHHWLFLFLYTPSLLHRSDAATLVHRIPAFLTSPPNLPTQPPPLSTRIVAFPWDSVLRFLVFFCYKVFLGELYFHSFNYHVLKIFLKCAVLALIKDPDLAVGYFIWLSHHNSTSSLPFLYLPCSFPLLLLLTPYLMPSIPFSLLPTHPYLSKSNLSPILSHKTFINNPKGTLSFPSPFTCECLIFLTK